MPQIEISRAEFLMQRGVEILQKKFGLLHWTIGIRVHSASNPEWVADVAIEARYFRAWITIDVYQHLTEESIIDSLRHEMIHVLLGEGKSVLNSLHAALKGRSAVFESVREVFSESEERTVALIEKTLDRLGLTSESLYHEINSKDSDNADSRSERSEGTHQSPSS